MIAFPSKLQSLHPAWSTCGGIWFTGYDPPRPLTPVSAMVPPITSDPIVSSTATTSAAQVARTSIVKATSERPSAAGSFRTLAIPRETLDPVMIPAPLVDGVHGADIPTRSTASSPDVNANDPQSLSSSGSVWHKSEDTTSQFSSPKSVIQHRTRFINRQTFDLVSQKTLPVTIASHIFTPTNGGLAIEGETISYGHSPVTLSGSQMSADHVGHLVLGTKTYRLPEPQITSQPVTKLPNGDPITHLADGRYVYQSLTLVPGAPELTISGTAMSLDPSSNLILQYKASSKISQTSDLGRSSATIAGSNTDPNVGSTTSSNTPTLRGLSLALSDTLNSEISPLPHVNTEDALSSDVASSNAPLGSHSDSSETMSSVVFTDGIKLSRGGRLTSLSKTTCSTETSALIIGTSTMPFHSSDNTQVSAFLSAEIGRTDTNDNKSIGNSGSSKDPQAVFATIASEALYLVTTSKPTSTNPVRSPVSHGPHIHMNGTLVDPQGRSDVAMPTNRSSGHAAYTTLASSSNPANTSFGPPSSKITTALSSLGITYLKSPGISLTGVIAGLIICFFQFFGL